MTGNYTGRGAGLYVTNALTVPADATIIASNNTLTVANGANGHGGGIFLKSGGAFSGLTLVGWADDAHLQDALPDGTLVPV